MREFLLYALAVVVLVIPRINPATVSNEGGKNKENGEVPKAQEVS